MVLKAASPGDLVRRAWEFAHSVRLALTLMILCALIAVPGTLVPADRAEQFWRETLGPQFLAPARALGLLETYRSPPFVALVGLLGLNVALCTWRRIRAGSGRAARQGWLPLCTDVALHASILCILAGGVGKALLGFTGTQYLVVGVPTDAVYDWKARADVPLGFALLAKERVDEYYPFQLKAGVSDAGGNRVALLDLAEGRSAELPGGALRLSLRSYDLESATVEIAAEHGGRREVAVLSLREGSPAVPAGTYAIAPVAWRRELKQVRARIAVIDGGREVKQEWLATNARVAYRGTSAFLTGWGRDDFGNLNVGIQVSRDPAAPLFWSGCTLFSLATVSFLLLRPRKGSGG